MLEHGGRLRLAAEAFGQPLADWIDLSTGINPITYPIPELDAACWNRLPEDNDGLEAAAAAYYENPNLLVLPGSQAAIQALPSLFPPQAIACVSPLYEEHPAAWERAGHKLRRLPTLQRALAAMTPSILLCNPNNPTAQRIPRAALVDAAAQLRRRGGLLIVDEAFGDAQPEHCVTPLAASEEAPNLIVLRSLGKFFGLAGARVGFLFAAADLCERLRERLGPWPVSHPARAVARAALTDTAWHASTRANLAASARRLADLLAPLGDVTCTELFCTLKRDDADAVYQALAQRAILVRRFEGSPLLRFGLPGNAAQWERLGAALSVIPA